MPRASGTFAPPASSWYPTTTGASATKADWDALLADLSSALTQSVSRDGQSTMTANIPMTGFKFTGLAAGSNTGDSVRWEQLFSHGAVTTMASAATVDIGGQNAAFIEITGVTGVSSLGVNYNGPRFIRFAGVLILTHNATTFNLPGAVNITTVAGDTCIAIPNVTANGWNIYAYQRSAALPAASGANTDITSLASATTATTQAAGDGSTKIATNAYVDTEIATYGFNNSNRITNGDMVVAQRGTSFAAIASGAYSLDRWVYTKAGAIVGTVSQSSDVPSGNEFQFSLRHTVTTIDNAIAAGDFCILSQKIEGYDVRDMIGAYSIAAFWVRGAKTGVHTVAFRNSGTDRSYVIEYTINVADTWQLVSVVIPAGLITAGTWNWTSGTGLWLDFPLYAGSTFQTATANSWQAGNFSSTAAAVQTEGDTIGNIFAVTGVRFVAAPFLPSFQHLPIAESLVRCQRHAWAYTGGGLFFANGTTIFEGTIQFPQSMRSTPTVTVGSTLQLFNTTSASDITPSSANITTIAINNQAAGVRFNNYTGLSSGQPGASKPASGTTILFSSDL